MGAWVSTPECGLPIHQLTQVPGSERIVTHCARTGALWVVGLLGAAAIALLIISFTWKQEDERGLPQPVVPLWTVAIPLGIAAGWAAVAVPLARAKLRVANADLRTSGMKKSSWLEYKAADARTRGQVFGALGASSIVASAVLGTSV